MKDDNSSDASSAMCGVLCFAGQGKTQWNKATTWNEEVE
jgi:hypothetical protein